VDHPLALLLPGRGVLGGVEVGVDQLVGDDRPSGSDFASRQDWSPDGSQPFLSPLSVGIRFLGMRTTRNRRRSGRLFGPLLNRRVDHLQLHLPVGLSNHARFGHETLTRTLAMVGVRLPVKPT
jgi:hypothetical protein